MTREQQALNKIKEEFGCDPSYYDLGGEFELLEMAVTPKKYLKWEDLEFDVPTSIKVKMGDTQYLLSLRISLSDVKSVVLRDNDLIAYLHLHEKDKQFFNDLRLEVVEE